MRHSFIAALAVSAALAAAALVFSQPASAQQPAAPQVQVQPATVTPTPPAVPLAPRVVAGDFKVNTLSASRFVVVRDMGDHQLVLVYEVNDKGQVSQSDKKKFFY